MTREEREILLDFLKNKMPCPQPFDNSEKSCNENITLRNALQKLIIELEQEPCEEG